MSYTRAAIPARYLTMTPLDRITLEPAEASTIGLLLLIFRDSKVATQDAV